MFPTPVILRPGKLRGAKGWCVFEGEGVEPFYPGKSQAVGYAISRAAAGPRALEYHDAAGNVLKRLEIPEVYELNRRRKNEQPDEVNTMRSPPALEVAVEAERKDAHEA